MPHVVVKGRVEGHESTVFGLTRGELERAGRCLRAFGGRVGQDGQSFCHPPLVLISTLENLFGYHVLTSAEGTQRTAIWTLHRPV